MKNITFTICCFFFLSIAAKCQSDKTIVQIELSKVTRGYQEFIRISPDSVNVYKENGRDTQKPVVKYGRKLEPEEWTKLVKYTSEVSLEDFSKLPSPTMKRAVDAAMHSTITITTKDGKSYAHGYDDEDSHPLLQPLRKTIREVSNTEIK